MQKDCICHSGTDIRGRCHPEDEGWSKCYMKEETTVWHIFNSMEVEDLDSVPWEFIQEHYKLNSAEIKLCKTIVQEELDMNQKLGV